MILCDLSFRSSVRLCQFGDFAQFTIISRLPSDPLLILARPAACHDVREVMRRGVVTARNCDVSPQWERFNSSRRRPTSVDASVRSPMIRVDLEYIHPTNRRALKALSSTSFGFGATRWYLVFGILLHKTTNLPNLRSDAQIHVVTDEHTQLKHPHLTAQADLSISTALRLISVKSTCTWAAFPHSVIRVGLRLAAAVAHDGTHSDVTAQSTVC